jgi:choline dehydrogenase-like flavoprotein
MLADGATVPDGEVVRGDVCVVGGGPAGLAIARELGAAGIEVVLLERGPDSGRPPPPDTAVNVGIPYHLDTSRSFEVGGSVQRWRARTPLGRGFGRLRELERIDFERRDWIQHSGWPFAKEALQTFYARARQLFEFDWPSEDPEQTWDRELHSGPFAVDSALTTKVFSFANPAVFPGVVWRSIRNSEQVLALTNSVAVELRSDASPSHISSVLVRTAREHGFTVEARVYVLAAGGIENPRLLLASRHRHPDGVGNDHDLVGRFFMEHPHYASGRLTPANGDAFSRDEHFSIHVHDGIPIQKKYTLPDEVVRREGLLGCAFRFEPKPVTISNHTLRYSQEALRSIERATKLGRSFARRRLPPGGLTDLAAAIGGSHHIARYLANRVTVMLGRRLRIPRYVDPSQFFLRTMAEQAPNPDSRVRLSAERDAFGVPIAELDWRLSAQDLDSMRRTQELVGRVLRTVGRHRRVESLLKEGALPPALSGGNHHMGTTRMHDSPREGVVDRQGRVHGVHNLYVAGSSVFPTVGYANPTLTLLALALRLADHVKGELT